MGLKKGYVVVVEGQYVAKIPGSKDKEIKKYKVEVIMISMDSALSMIVNSVLTPLVAKQDVNFLHVRTHTITDVSVFGGATLVGSDPKFMGRRDLIDYIRGLDSSFDPTLFPTLEELKSKVAMYQEDPSKFKDFIERHGDSLRMFRDMYLANGMSSDDYYGSYMGIGLKLEGGGSKVEWTDEEKKESKAKKDKESDSRLETLFRNSSVGLGQGGEVEDVSLGDSDFKKKAKAKAQSVMSMDDI